MRPYNTKKYHFWTFRINEKSLTTEVLWRGKHNSYVIFSNVFLAYYKSASAFIFVYDITNAESFKKLEQSVQSVLSIVAEKDFYGILIGNKDDLDNKRVRLSDDCLCDKSLGNLL